MKYDGPLKGKIPALLIYGITFLMGPFGLIPRTVINITPGYPTSNISTTLQTTKGVLVPINMSPSGRLGGLDDGWLNSRVFTTRSMTPEGVRDSYQELFIAYKYNWP